MALGGVLQHVLGGKNITGVTPAPSGCERGCYSLQHQQNQEFGGKASQHPTLGRGKFPKALQADCQPQKGIKCLLLNPFLQQPGCQSGVQSGCPMGTGSPHPYLQEQDELGEPLDGLHHQPVERHPVRAGHLPLLCRGEKAIKRGVFTPNGDRQPRVPTLGTR